MVRKMVDLAQKKVRILLDTDANNEIDDQHAIAYLLLSGDSFISLVFLHILQKNGQEP